MPYKVDWVFFDLGSTLTDESTFEKYFLGKVYESLKENGIYVNREAFNKTLEAVLRREDVEAEATETLSES